MFKKFINYQKILSASMQFENKNKVINLDALSYFLIFIFIGFFNSIFDGFSVITYFIGLSLIYIYKIINSNNKLYKSVPVSGIYTYINIILYPYIVILFACLILTILQVLLVLIFNEVSLAYLFVGTFGISFTGGWKAILFVGCISIIIINIFMPIFCIKKRTLRKILIKLIVILIAIGIVVIKKTLPIYEGKGETSILQGIVTNYSYSLVIVFCICGIILPISNYLSYKLYMGRRVKND